MYLAGLALEKEPSFQQYSPVMYLELDILNVLLRLLLTHTVHHRQSSTLHWTSSMSCTASSVLTQCTTDSHPHRIALDVPVTHKASPRKLLVQTKKMKGQPATMKVTTLMLPPPPIKGPSGCKGGLCGQIV